MTAEIRTADGKCTVVDAAFRSQSTTLTELLPGTAAASKDDDRAVEVPTKSASTIEHLRDYVLLRAESDDGTMIKFLHNLPTGQPLAVLQTADFLQMDAVFTDFLDLFVMSHSVAELRHEGGLVETDELLHKLKKQETDKRILESMRNDLSSRTEFVRTLMTGFGTSDDVMKPSVLCKLSMLCEPLSRAVSERWIRQAGSAAAALKEIAAFSRQQADAEAKRRETESDDVGVEHESELGAVFHLPAGIHDIGKAAVVYNCIDLTIKGNMLGLVDGAPCVLRGEWETVPFRHNFLGTQNDDPPASALLRFHGGRLCVQNVQLDGVQLHVHDGAELAVSHCLLGLSDQTHVDNQASRRTSRLRFLAHELRWFEQAGWRHHDPLFLDDGGEPMEQLTAGGALDVRLNCGELAALCGGAVVAGIRTSVNITSSQIVNNVSVFGGAVFVAHGARLRCDRTQFSRNCSIRAAGGAIYSKGTVELSNCAFANNIAGRDDDDDSPVDDHDYFTGGGAIFIRGNGTALRARNCSFVGNRAELEYQGGGAICTVRDRGGTLTEVIGVRTDLKGCHFVQNTASTGGAICALASPSRGFLRRRVALPQNNSHSSNGGVFLSSSEEQASSEDSEDSEEEIPIDQDDEVHDSNTCVTCNMIGRCRQKLPREYAVEQAGSLRVLSCSFTRNLAGQYWADGYETTCRMGGGGGAIFADGVPLTVKESQFEENEAESGDGGAIRSTANAEIPSLSAVDCLFTQNRASFGGAVSTAESMLAIRDCSFCENRVITTDQDEELGIPARGRGIAIFDGSLDGSVLRGDNGFM